MCLILLALGQRDDLPLVVIANRDEFYARPTRVAHWWEDHPDTFGGRDLQAQGTWMGVNKQGQFAAVTNVREPDKNPVGKLSRGDLTREFLIGTESAAVFLHRIESRGEDYAGFNLLLGDSRELWFYSNRQAGIRKLDPGIYGISNGHFDESWPKLSTGKAALAKALADNVNDAELIDIMCNEQQAADELLPNTGVPLATERILSSRFIKSAGYGTRASSLVKFTHHNSIHFSELNYDHETDSKTLIYEEFSINRDKVYAKQTQSS
ncbi:MAG: hypothetical protein ACI9KN_000965 [Gammaproteobacteria bacterium]|jgi:uncharacterized protein with NRDE domain